jgi:hypothetical protein
MTGRRQPWTRPALFVTAFVVSVLALGPAEPQAAVALGAASLIATAMLLALSTAQFILIAQAPGGAHPTVSTGVAESAVLIRSAHPDSPGRARPRAPGRGRAVRTT